ncbi:MAG: GNAT family N-acetyltransferase [Methanoregulaceae archaeon]|nr:GNAT family N-acetyltransferase [Methanoregulaceae archaeon]
MRIETPRLILRDWTRGDAASLARAANNPRVAAMMKDSFPNPCTPKDARLFIYLTRRNPSGIFLAIEFGGEVIGGIAIHRLADVRRRTAEIGYWLAESYWGRGIATEAVSALVPIAFATYDIIRVQAGIFSNNPASMRVLEKCGFHREAVHSKAFFKNGELLDEVMYVHFGPVSGN